MQVISILCPPPARSMSLPRFGLATLERTEQRRETLARLPQFHLMHAQHCKNPLRRLPDEHCSTREKGWESVFELH
jgi:hypothetical protein